MMNRREVLKSVAIMVGGAFSAPTLLAMDRWEQKVASTDPTFDFVLSESHKKIVAEVAEMIIPETKTPGARQAGVPDFIVMMLQDCYRKPEHNSFTTGLQDLEKRKFLSLNPADRTALLKTVEMETVGLMKEYSTQQSSIANNKAATQSQELQGLPFWRLIKELTLLGYFTSEIGIKSSFDYVPIPGKLELVKLKTGQKAFAY